jgi:acyl carrier protein
MSYRNAIEAALGDIWNEYANGTPMPTWTDDTVLLSSGLDSLGFAVLVVELEERLGIDPFTASAEAVYPTTFGEFVEYYDSYDEPK